LLEEHRKTAQAILNFAAQTNSLGKREKREKERERERNSLKCGKEKKFHCDLKTEVCLFSSCPSLNS